MFHLLDLPLFVASNFYAIHLIILDSQTLKRTIHIFFKQTIIGPIYGWEFRLTHDLVNIIQTT